MMSEKLIVELVVEAMERLDSPRTKEMMEYYGDSPSVVDDFRLVAIRLPRQSGHSLAAAKLLQLYPKSILLVPKHMMRDNYRTMLTPDIINDRIFGGDFYMLHSILTNREPTQLDMVIFDPAHLFSPGTVRKIREEILPRFRPKMLVELE